MIKRQKMKNSENNHYLIRQENSIFFKRWLKKPTQLGTLAPISQSLAQLASNLMESSTTELASKTVVEIGAGTGRLSRFILDKGIQPNNFYAVELDNELCSFLKENLSGANIIQGDAANLPMLLPPDIVGQVDILYSVIPLMYLSQSMRDGIYQAARQVLKPNGVFYHVCYSPVSPYATRKNIVSKRVISKWFNLPSGFVWTFGDA